MHYSWDLVSARACRVSVVVVVVVQCGIWSGGSRRFSCGCFGGGVCEAAIRPNAGLTRRADPSSSSSSWPPPVESFGRCFVLRTADTSPPPARRVERRSTESSRYSSAAASHGSSRPGGSPPGGTSARTGASGWRNRTRARNASTCAPTPGGPTTCTRSWPSAQSLSRVPPRPPHARGWRLGRNTARSLELGRARCSRGRAARSPPRTRRGTGASRPSRTSPAARARRCPPPRRRPRRAPRRRGWVGDAIPRRARTARARRRMRGANDDESALISAASRTARRTVASRGCSSSTTRSCVPRRRRISSTPRARPIPHSPRAPGAHRPAPFPPRWTTSMCGTTWCAPERARARARVRRPRDREPRSRPRPLFARVSFPPTPPLT